LWKWGGSTIKRERKEFQVGTKEERFWAAPGLPEVADAAGVPVSGLVDETVGGVVAYVLGPQDRAQALADVLNAADKLGQAMDVLNSYGAGQELRGSLT
jgi:hypothetical protein